MYDDGTHGDMVPGDKVWSLRLNLPQDETIEYKYTNSGEQGVWGGSDESAGRNRSLLLHASSITTILDKFGK